MKSTEIIKTVQNTISKHGLIEENDRVLVALSGGADSAALLHILYSLKDRLGITLAAAHINHGLRSSADRDMEFCRQLCDRFGIELFIKCADIRAEAKKAGLGEELYAREVRYSFFSSLGFDKIATAHNKNDNAETILFHFIRGAGTGGLSGIPYMRGNIIRPILDITKEDIFGFCRENNIEYVTDETNLEPIYTRNKLRLELIPQIERGYNSAFCDVVTKNARLIAADNDFLESLVAKEYDGEIVRDSFLKLDKALQGRVLQLHYKKTAQTGEKLSIDYIRAMLALIEKGETGRSVSLPGNFEAFFCYGRLEIRKKHAEIAYKYRIYPGKLLNIPEIGKNILISKSDHGDIFLDSADELYIRSREAGDIFFPVGMSGRKKLSDFFTDKKIPADKRSAVPLLICGNEIASVGNMRRDRRFQDKTKASYILEIKEADNAE